MKTILIVGIRQSRKKIRAYPPQRRVYIRGLFFEKFREEFGFSDWKMDKKLKSEISVGKIRQQKNNSLKPQTFMNLSGEAVAAAKKYYKVKLEDIIRRPR